MESKRRKVVHSECRQIISKVYHFLKTEYEFTLTAQGPNCDISHLSNIIQRTAEATTVSERTVQRILKEELDGPSTSSSKVQSPMKTRRRKDYKVDFEVVRSIIQEFHIVHKQIPTLGKLRSALKDKIGFDGSIETLRALLIKMGYQCRTTDINKKVLVERHNIQMWRLKYIKKITEYRSQGRPIVYTDLSYVLTDEQSATLNKLSSGTRFIIAHAGTEDGFIDNACAVYKNLGQMSFTYKNIYYVKWLNEKLLPNLPDRSVIVLDSCNTTSEKMLTSASNISEMQQWLTAKNIQFDSNLRKVELYEIIKKHKRNFRTFQIDDYIESKGFEVLRLPPYHPELNAIENIWKILKKFVTWTNVEPNITNTEKIIYEGIGNITGKTWQNVCKRVIIKEVEYMKHFEAELEFIIHQQDDNDDETVFEESSCDSN